jgi:hypothetical protein
MALTANITPVQILNQSANILSTYITNYGLNSINCDAYWWLTNESGVTLYQDSWIVPQEVLATWGTDDTVIIDALAEAKGFTIISIITGEL